MKLCVIKPKKLLSNLGGVRFLSTFDIFLVKQLNFRNLTLWLWKTVTWGLTYFDQYVFACSNGLSPTAHGSFLFNLQIKSPNFPVSIVYYD